MLVVATWISAKDVKMLELVGVMQTQVETGAVEKANVCAGFALKVEFVASLAVMGGVARHTRGHYLHRHISGYLWRHMRYLWP